MPPLSITIQLSRRTGRTRHREEAISSTEHMPNIDADTLEQVALTLVIRPLVQPKLLILYKILKYGLVGPHRSIFCAVG